MKTIKQKIYSAVTFFLLTGVVIAQPANQFFLESLPQSFYLNPGKKQQSTFHSNFLLPQLDASTINTGFTMSDLITGNQIIPANILPSLDENNYLGISSSLNILNVGFKVKEKNYFSYNASLRFNLFADFSKDFFTTLINGPGETELVNGVLQFVNDTIDLDGTRYSATAYLEHGFGYSREINEKLIIGGRLKYLQGLVNGNGNLDGVSIVNGEGSIELNSSLSVKSSIPDTTAIKNRDISSISGNNGFAIDLGGSYIVNEQLTAYASITDLGVISWGSANSKTLSNNGASFTFDGFQASDLGDTAITNGLGDSIQDIFKLQETPGAYSTNLPTRFFVGGSYQFNKNWSGDVLYSGQFVNGKFLSSAVVGGGLNVNRWLEAKLSYTIANNTYNNVGLAAVVNLGAWQLYFVTDNILAATQLDYANHVSASVGMNFTFGRKKFFGVEPKDKSDKKSDKKESKKEASDDKKETESSTVPLIDSVATPVVEEAVEEKVEDVVEEVSPVNEFNETMKDSATQVVDSVVAPVIEVDSLSLPEVPEVEPVIEEAVPEIAPTAIPVEETMETSPVEVPALETVEEVVEEVKENVEEKVQEEVKTTTTEAVQETVEEVETIVTETVTETVTEPSTEIKSNGDAESLDKVIEEIKEGAK